MCWHRLRTPVVDHVQATLPRKRHKKTQFNLRYFTSKPASSLSPTRDATKSYALHLIRDPTVFTVTVRSRPAEEQLRRDIRDRPHVPADQRLCQFCEHAVESPLHALFECEGNDDLAASRQAFMSVMTSEVPRIEHWHAGEPLGLLYELLTCKALAPHFAEFAYEVTEIYNAHPMRLP
jgi:hypothetical protein